MLSKDLLLRRLTQANRPSAHITMLMTLATVAGLTLAHSALAQTQTMQTQSGLFTVRAIAPDNGWAAIDGGTTGGSQAKPEQIFTVTNRKELLNAIKNARDMPKIIAVKGTIDLSDGQPYRNFADQKKRSQIKLPSNTTLIGISADAGFTHGSIVIKKVHNVIVRNLRIETPVDVAPHFEKGDGWNAEWDGMNIDNGQHIWVDHVTITDGAFTDAMYQSRDGWPYVQHDGALDIKHASDLITVSSSLFLNHNKTMLIGHSDHNGAEDRGKLRVTLVGNVFKNIVQRTPRVRFGKVHAYNNVFQSSRNSGAVYRYKYSFGLGKEGQILSQNNLFTIQGSHSACDLFKELNAKGTAILTDSNSLYNGKAVDLSHCHLTGKITWTPPYHYQLQAPQTLHNLIDQVGSGLTITQPR